MLAPTLVLGATSPTGDLSTGLNGLITNIQSIVTALVPVVIGLGLLLFLWGVLRYMLTKDEIQKAEARTFMLWGIIALFVMASVWGFVSLLKSTVFGTGNIVAPTAPRVPGTSN